MKADLKDEMRHSVMVAAPHTSNWDFPLALLAFWKMDAHIRYFIKDNYTKSIFGWFFRWTGAIGVDRSKKSNQLTDYAIELLKQNEEMIILVPAEGTRKWVEKWRTGFYRIATETKVPLVMGYMDYKKKEGGVLDIYHLTGDFEKDMLHIQEKYRHISGKTPKNYNPKIF